MTNLIELNMFDTNINIDSFEENNDIIYNENTTYYFM